MGRERKERKREKEKESKREINVDLSGRRHSSEVFTFWVKKKHRNIIEENRIYV